jgi:hypothetical protein
MAVKNERGKFWVRGDLISFEGNSLCFPCPSHIFGGSTQDTLNIHVVVSYDLLPLGIWMVPLKIQCDLRYFSSLRNII